MSIFGLIALIVAGIFFVVQLVKLIKEIKLKREITQKKQNSTSDDDYENKLKEC